MSQEDLFHMPGSAETMLPEPICLSPDLPQPERGAWYLPGAVTDHASGLLAAIATVEQQAPWRHMETPGGRRMSVAMTNCGQRGWVTDRTGYRYQEIDPVTDEPWPPMPPLLKNLAGLLAQHVGYEDYSPDVCLINRYQPGASMGLHQDRDEQDRYAPIVSLSLGLDATFIWGGFQRAGKTHRFTLHHGDVVIWGGPERMRFHGVARLKAGQHPATGEARINITFRQTGL